MILYPNIDPVAIHITESVQIRWYGLMYIVGFVIAWFLMRSRTKNLAGWQNIDTLYDFFFYAAIGVLAGGRIGYVLFYDFPALMHDPLLVFKIWQPGMSFHGGLIGVILAVWLFAKRHGFTFFTVADLCAPAVPIALGAGRVGNFINGELWGRPTDVPWAFVFPHVDYLPRHPSQLYAVGLEGILLFIILWWYSSKPREAGQVSGLFLVGYGCIRIIEEFFRQPDPQYGYLAFGWVTMGDILCLPMILLGLFFFFHHCRKKGGVV